MFDVISVGLGCRHRGWFGSRCWRGRSDREIDLADDHPRLARARYVYAHVSERSGDARIQSTPDRAEFVRELVDDVVAVRGERVRARQTR